MMVPPTPWSPNIRCPQGSSEVRAPRCKCVSLCPWEGRCRAVTRRIRAESEERSKNCNEGAADCRLLQNATTGTYDADGDREERPQLPAGEHGRGLHEDLVTVGRGAQGGGVPARGRVSPPAGAAGSREPGGCSGWELDTTEAGVTSGEPTGERGQDRGL